MGNRYTQSDVCTRGMGADLRLGRLARLATVLIFSLVCLFQSALAAELETDFKTRFDLPREPKQLVQEILARAEFQGDQEGSWIDWWRWYIQELARRAIKWIATRFPGVEPIRIPAAGIGATLVDALLLGLLTLAFILALWGAVRLFAARRHGQRVVPEDDRTPGPGLLGSEQAHAMARTFAQQGRFREALMYTFRYTVLLLDETGRLAVSPGATNGELLQRARQVEPLYTILGQMVPLFNSIRYGDAPCTREDYEQAAALARQVTGGIAA